MIQPSCGLGGRNPWNTQMMQCQSCRTVATGMADNWHTLGGALRLMQMHQGQMKQIAHYKSISGVL
jgi:hypothetical protein